MKVAVILTGHMRCWRDVFPNFKEKIIDRYGNPDIFIHTWDEEGWWIPGDKDMPKGVYDKTPSVEFEDIQDAYKPIALIVSKWSDYEPVFDYRAKLYSHYAHRPKNILSMFHKLGSGVRLMEDYMSFTGEHYDLVIRMRPDMIFHEDLPEFDPQKFYTLAHRNHLGQGTGDMIQVSNPFNMVAFSKISCFINHVYMQTQMMCPHLMSVQWIQNMGLPWQEFSIHKELKHTPNGEYNEAHLNE